MDDSEGQSKRAKSLTMKYRPGDDPVVQEEAIISNENKVWSKGDKCLALFSGDKKYYEAKIEKIYRKPNTMEVKVKYIGYDSEDNEVVPVSCLKPVHSSSQSCKETVRKDVNSEVVKTELKAKEKDNYMRQKYDITDEKAASKGSIKQKKQKFKELDFLEGKGNHGVELKAHNHPMNNNGKRNDDSIKQEKRKEQNFQGFTDLDLEKPHFDVKPTAGKVDFCISKEGCSPSCFIPACINQYLRDYQRAGTCFMYNHFVQNRGCILADDMGLGKTVQVIALIAAILGKTGTKEDAMPSFLRSKKKEDNGHHKGAFLIISPSSVLYNWEDELNTWGYFKIARFHGNSKKETLKNARKGKLDVVLTTYETFRMHIDLINDVEWLCLVMDEAHKVKDPNSLLTKAAKKAKCLRRIGLTGTPMQNTMEELWCLLDWANRDCLGPLDDFKDEFILPIKLGQRFDATKRELATARKKQQEFAILKVKWILRRKKDLLVDQLPRKDERVVFASLTELQFSLYEQILAFPSAKWVMSSDDLCPCKSGKTKLHCCHKLDKGQFSLHQKEIFHIITLLRKVSNHAGMLLPCHKTSEKQQQMALSVCKKLFQNFPILEEVFRSGSFTRITDVKFSGKLEIADRLFSALREDKDKVLLFSSSLQLLNILEAYVISKGYVYRRIDGNTKAESRVDIVREFNSNNDVFICLGSTKAGGLGLNFTGANIVIIFDPCWNPSFDNQAEDRAYRIGQRRNVKVYRLISEGCIEENVYLRQIYKQQLSNIAMHSSNERRLFTAVKGVKTRQGELFGLKNLFKLRETGSNLTRDLLKRTEIIESGVRMVNYELDAMPKDAIRVKCGACDDDSLDEFEQAAAQNLDNLSCKVEYVTENSFTFDEEIGFAYQNGKTDKDVGIKFDDGTEEELECSTDEDEPPLKWKKSIRNEKERMFTFVKKRRKKSCIKSSSDEELFDGRKDKGVETNCVKMARMIEEDSQGVDDPNSLKIMDEILDKCGVTYTSKIISKSSAEEKMTSEAIKDVFWHGMHSQEPAYFFDHSMSEESDDILCFKRDAGSSSSIQNDDAKVSFPFLLSKRVFERIGSDIFLIGGTPPSKRRQQFDKIACYYGFKSSLDFARDLINCNEHQVKEKLFRFYKTEEPSVVESSSFQSVFCEGLSAENKHENPERKETNDEVRMVYKRQGGRNKKKEGLVLNKKRKMRKHCLTLHQDLNVYGDFVDNDFSEGKLVTRLQMEKRRPRFEADDIAVFEPHFQNDSHPDSTSLSSNDDDNDRLARGLDLKEIVEETQLGASVVSHKETASDINEVSSPAVEKNGINEKVLEGHCSSIDDSEDLLHEMMFNSEHNNLNMSENTRKSDFPPSKLSHEHTEDGSFAHGSSSSILDELMGVFTVSKIQTDTDGKSRMHSSPSNMRYHDGTIEFIDNDSQNSTSVLDELMG